jgi:hypothetical protein
MRVGGRVQTAIREQHVLSITAFVCLLYLLVTVVDIGVRSQLSIPLLAAVDVTHALPVVLALSLGVVAVWSLPIAIVVTDLMTGALGPWTVVGICAQFYLGYAAYRTAERLDLDVRVPVSELARPAPVGRLFLVVAIAATGAGAIAGWGSEIVGSAPFFVTAPVSALGYFVLTLVVGLPLLAILRVGLRTSEDRFDGELSQTDKSGVNFGLRRVTLLTGAWFVLGIVGSIGYRTLEKLPTTALSRRNLAFIKTLERPDLFGVGAGRIQVLLGVILVSALLVTFLESHPENGEATE